MYYDYALTNGWLRTGEGFNADKVITQEEFAALVMIASTAFTPVDVPVTEVPVVTNELANTSRTLLSLN